MNKQVKKYAFSVDPFSRVFLENEDKSLYERIGLGMMEIATYTDIHIDEPIVLAHAFPLASDSAAWYQFGSGIIAVGSRFDDNISAHPEYADALKEIKEKMLPWSTHDKIDNAMTDEEKKLTEEYVCWGGGWGGHGNPDYGLLLHLGTDGLRNKIERCRRKHYENDGFYQGCLYALGALDILGQRFGALAEQRLAACTDPDLRAKYEKMAEAFRVIPKKPAYDFHSAVQLFWMAFSFDGIDSPGRLDQFMGDFYVTSPRDEANDVLARLWECFHNTRSWNLTISGSDANFRDMTNPLSYAILDITEKTGYNAPNLTLRVHRNTPEALWLRAAKCLSGGTGLPAIYNDEVVCEALAGLGIPRNDAHEYCLNGCNQIDIFGKSHMGLEDGEVNMLKCLERVLYRPETLRIDNWQDFFAAYLNELRCIIDAVCIMSNRSQEIYARFAPNPLRSVLFAGCLETGRDYKNGGPLYGHGQVLAEGIADTADSLWAIRHLVFDTRKYTLARLISAVQHDFSGDGDSEILADCRACDKFGNDLDTVDPVAAAIVDAFMKHLRTHHTFRGGIFSGGCSPYDRAADNGAAVGAMPNGRRREDSILADSIGATPGMDRNGPTALLNSCEKYRQYDAGSGFIVNTKFDRTLFQTQTGQAAFIALCQTYFKNGGQMVTAAVVSREALLDAKIHPERHGDLIVRVGGYSDYFVKLTPELQDNVIARSTF